MYSIFNSPYSASKSSFFAYSVLFLPNKSKTFKPPSLISNYYFSHSLPHPLYSFSNPISPNIRPKQKPLCVSKGVSNKEFGDDLLSHGNPYYHRRWFVSLSCSGWEGVGPNRYGRQT